MPSWKKVITSGSDASLNSLIATSGIVITGSLITTGSNTLIGNTLLTGSLNISGSTTQIGNNNLLGTTNLSGSIVISGSIGASANLSLGGTLRLDPAQDPGNTNDTASFLFTSASNTAQGYDLYYRQDGNLVKFKWLEGGISSGLLYGGIISASGATIYVSSGSGVILDPNANFSEEISPQFTYVTWPNYSASATYLTSSQNTYLYADAAGTIHQQTQFFDQTQYEQAIPLGRATHPNYATITGIGSNVQTTYDSDNQQSAFIRAFGPLKVDGFSINAHPGTLGFGVGSGVAYTLGGFYPQDPNSPSHYHGNAFATSSIARAYRSGSGVRLDNNGGAFYSTVDPDYWDDGTGVLNTMSTGDWQIQRVFANPVTGRVVVYYGQNTYTTLLNALQYLATDSFTEGEFTAHSLIFVGYLVLKGQTNNLTDTNNNRIINAGIFRNIAGGSSGGGAVAQTLDDLGDVTITTPTNGQALIYNSGTWENGTPSLATTASYSNTSTSASFATTATTSTTASYVQTAQTASYVLNAVSASFSTTASYATQALSASYAPGGGAAFPYTGSAEITGSLGVTGSFSVLDSIDGTNKILIGSGPIPGSTEDSVNWDSRTLFDSNGNFSVRWGILRTMYDSSAVSSIDWQNRTTIDTGTKTSIDWQNRQLKDSSGNEVLNWSSGVAITGSLTVSGSSTFTNIGPARFSGSFGVQGALIPGSPPMIPDIGPYDAIKVDDVNNQRKLYGSPQQGASASIDFGNRTLHTRDGGDALSWSGQSGTYETYLYNQQYIAETNRSNLFANNSYGGQVLGDSYFNAAVMDNDLVYLNPDGQWYQVDQATDSSTRMLGIAKNIFSQTGSVIIEGDVVVSTSPGYPSVASAGYGRPAYIKQGAGTAMDTTIPISGYVRILGHCYWNAGGGGTEWIMKFRPSHEWIEL